MENEGRIFEFDRVDGHVITGFSDELVALLRDVRQMKALGVRLDRALEAEVATAEKFYK